MPENYIFRAGDYQADNIKTIGLRLISEVIWINDLEYKLVLNHINDENLTHLKLEIRFMLQLLKSQMSIL